MPTPAPAPLDPSTPAISVSSLSFVFDPAVGELALHDVDLELPQGARCLLIGANGAGKSTLLRILAGKRLTKSSAKVLGQDVFQQPPDGVCYLGTEWAMNPVVRSDIVVSHFLDSVGGYRHKDRRDRLLDILDVDLDWHMHQVSDGERRRVQLVMGLMAPWRVLLLDEVTVDLDVMVRADLLDFLIEESEVRGATIVYATHIFDGLQTFPTHVSHLQLGTTTTSSPLPWPLPPSSSPSLSPSTNATLTTASSSSASGGSPLLSLALQWLREDRAERKRREDAEGIEGKRRRGARRGEETTDSEEFYSKFDYWKGK